LCIPLPTLKVQHALRCSVRLGAMFQALHQSSGLWASMSIGLRCRVPGCRELSDLLL
jgi:hypothetical protein